MTVVCHEGERKQYCTNVGKSTSVVKIGLNIQIIETPTDRHSAYAFSNHYYISSHRLALKIIAFDKLYYFQHDIWHHHAVFVLVYASQPLRFQYYSL